MTNDRYTQVRTPRCCEAQMEHDTERHLTNFAVLFGVDNSHVEGLNAIRT